ncbi:MAG: alpha/beta fold hydrolase, partial [Phycisphaerae bacterium]
HGFPLSGLLWAHLPEALADRYRLIVPDLHGLGRSSVTDEVTMAGFADDLSGLLDQLDQAEPVVVMGLSMGGYIAFEFFRRHQRRVRALILADTRAEPDAPEAARQRSETAQKVLAEGSGVVADAMAGKLFGPGASTELREQWRQIMASSDRQGVAAALRAMRDRADSRPTLGDIDVPTLVVVGQDDALTPLACAETIHRGIRGSRLEVVPGAGHMTPVEQPEQFRQIVGGFLDELYEHAPAG